jgi:hypothetical protein
MNTDVPFIKDDLIEEAEKFSEIFFNRKQDLNALLSIALKENKKEVFADATFTGKYIIGLANVLNKAQNIPGVENIEQVKNDLSGSFNNFIDKLREIISGGNEEIKKSFEAEYFSFNHQSFDNLRKLADDFDKVKIFLNHLKREG